MGKGGMYMSQSPKAGHNKSQSVGFSKSAIQTPNAENAEGLAPKTRVWGDSMERNTNNAENADSKTRKMQLTGFIVTGFRWPPFCRKLVDPVIGDPVRQDNDKIWILGSFVS